jgi:hypothetical protein
MHQIDHSSFEDMSTILDSMLLLIHILAPRVIRLSRIHMPLTPLHKTPQNIRLLFTMHVSRNDRDWRHLRNHASTNLPLQRTQRSSFQSLVSKSNYIYLFTAEQAFMDIMHPDALGWTEKFRG